MTAIWTLTQTVTGKPMLSESATVMATAMGCRTHTRTHCCRTTRRQDRHRKTCSSPDNEPRRASNTCHRPGSGCARGCNHPYRGRSSGWTWLCCPPTSSPAPCPLQWPTGSSQCKDFGRLAPVLSRRRTVQWFSGCLQMSPGANPLDRMCLRLAN